MQSTLTLPFLHASRLRRFRDFILSQVLTKRKAGIQEHFLGGLWFLLAPVLEMGVYFFLVVVVFNRHLFGDVPTFLGIMTGLIHFRVLQMTLQRSIRSIVSGRRILLQVRVDPMAFVAIGFLKQLQDAKYYIPLYIVTLIAFGFLPSPNVLWYPLVLLLLLTAAWSLTLLLACAFVYLRDLQEITQNAMRMLLYASPVIYPLSLIPTEYQPWYLLNPVATLLGLVQFSLLGLPAPPVGYIVGCVIFFVLLLYVAHGFYESKAPQFTKIM